MYFIKYGNDYIHDPRVEDYIVNDISFSTEENSCGYCDFTIYSNHPLYDKIKERDNRTTIFVYDDDRVIFDGFVYSVNKNFNLDKSIKCKGSIDFLSNFILPPHSSLGTPNVMATPSDIKSYFKWIITAYNNWASKECQFQIGTLSINDINSDVIYADYLEYKPALDCIKENILEVYGGCIRSRYIDGVRYIDYIHKWDSINSQIIEFGVNLTDYTFSEDSSDVITAIIPQGKMWKDDSIDEWDNGFYSTSDEQANSNKTYYILEDGNYKETEFSSEKILYEYDPTSDMSNLKIDIFDYENLYSGIPKNGQIANSDYYKFENMIYHLPSVKKYGYLTAVRDYDVDNVEDLIFESLLDLKSSISPKITIELKAVDMHLINNDVRPILLGDYVRIRSKPHNIDGYFLCANMDLNLNDPSQSIYTFGTTYDTLTGEQNSKIKELNSTINKQLDAISRFSTDNAETLKQIISSTESRLQAEIDSNLGSQSSGGTATLPSIIYFANDPIYMDETFEASYQHQYTDLLSFIFRIGSGSYVYKNFLTTCNTSESKTIIFSDNYLGIYLEIIFDSTGHKIKGSSTNKGSGTNFDNSNCKLVSIISISL